MWLPEATGDDAAALHRLAAGPPRRLGELVTDVYPGREPLVAQALKQSRESGSKVGEVLVSKGVITPAERDAMLEFQRHQRGEAPTEDRLRLGQVLASRGDITQSQLGEALERQRRTGRALGEELVAAGHISHEVLRSALAHQRQLVIAALVAAMTITMALPAPAAPAEAARPVSQSIDFVIKIPPVMRMEVLRQAPTIQITQQDVERGYIEVSSASVLQVTANTPWAVSFEPCSNIASSARVSGLAGEIVVGPGGGSFAGLRAMRAATTFDLSYRFELAPEVSPGTYPWPLAIRAHAA